MKHNYPTFRTSKDLLTGELIINGTMALHSNVAVENGNRGYTTIQSCENVTNLTLKNMDKIIHVTGQRCDVNFQVAFQGNLKAGDIILNYKNEPVKCELYDLYMYAACHDFTVFIEGDFITVVSAKCNKLHGLKRQFDFFNSFIECEGVNVAVYDANDNSFITSYNGNYKDVTKFCQSKYFTRGYNTPWYTNRKTEITFTK